MTFDEYARMKYMWNLNKQERLSNDDLYCWSSMHIPINPIKSQEEPFLLKQEPLEEEYEEVN